MRIFLCLLVLGCTPARASIKIGAVLSLSGDCASGVDEIVEAANLAIAEINESGGVLGRDLSLLTANDRSDETAAKTATEDLIAREHPAGIVGAQCSSLTLAAASVASANQVVMVSPISTSPLLTSAADDGYLFRTASSDALQGKLIAQRAQAQGLQSFVILHDGDAYGRGLRDTIKAQFGADRVLVTVELPEEVTDAKAIWTQAFAQGHPQAIAIITFPGNAGPLLDEFGKSFSSGEKFFFPDALKNSDFQTQLKSAAATFPITATNNEVSALGAPVSQIYTDYVARFEARYGHAPDLGTGSPQAYDAVYLIALAIEQAGVEGGAAVRDAMQSVSSGGTAFTAVQFAAARKAIAAGEDVDYAGVTGAVDFDAQGDVVGVYDVWRVVDAPRGDFAIVQQAVAP